MPLLEVENLVTEFKGTRGPVRASDGVSFSIEPGEVLGLVGESGSGKSVTSRAIMGLVEPASAIKGGAIRFAGQELRALGQGELRQLRAAEVAMIFQDPMSALNPVLKMGDQLARVYVQHMSGAPENRGLSKRELMARGRARALDLLQTVRIPDPAIRYEQYPHQFSGGMRQRVMIAMALMCRPKLLIADEPTTALDATVELQVVELLKDLQRQFGMAILFISHNLGVVAKLCDRVIVMYAGRVVESAPTADLFSRPLHPYAQALLASIPRGSKHDGRLQAIQGEPPDLARLPGGCSFRPRCRRAVEACAEPQELRAFGPDRRVACHRAELVEPETLVGEPA
jgi:oligopeptide/dipeptide ABC transporter ATP-binding protein